MKKLTLLCAAALLCGTFLVGCGSESNSDTKEPAASSQVESAQNNTAQNPEAATQQQSALTQETAIQKAKDTFHLTEATVTKCQRDYEDGIQVYEVDLVSGSTKYSVELDASNGAVREQSQEKITTGTAPSGSISAEEAIAVAEQAAGISGSTVVKNEFDYDDGKGVYEIELVQNNVQYEFEIDATTGAVLAQSQEHR